jgi:predicted DCC family thiol-disulfide oxidoreductase YuxK
MLINYWKNEERDSGINLAFARISLGIYAIWKLLSYDWMTLQQWPDLVFRKSPQSHLVLSTDNLSYITVEVIIAVVLLLCVSFGYRLGLTALLSSFVLAHLSGIHYAVTNPGSTFLPVVYMLLFIALYRDTDVLTVDALRKTRHKSLQSLHKFLKEGRPSSYPAPTLKWTLVTIGIVYFFTGFAKVQGGLFMWATGNNLARTIHMDAFRYLRDIPEVGRYIVNITPLATISAWASVILELGLIFTIFFGFSYWLFAIGLLLMHTLIAVGMQIFFFDQYILFALFLPWDKVYSYLANDNKLIIAYDEHCYFCARSLYIFKQLDVNRVFDFYTQTDLPEEYSDREGVELDEAMFVFDGTETYQGYHGFKRMFSHLGAFRPVAWLMNRTLVTVIGEKVYAYIAANRDRYFVCSID